MKIRFTKTLGGEKLYNAGHEIDSATINPDQLNRWLNRGVVVPVETEDPIKKATNDTLKARLTKARKDNA